MNDMFDLAAHEATPPEPDLPSRLGGCVGLLVMVCIAVAAIMLTVKLGLVLFT